MTVIYDNWERLVTATLRREQLRQSALRTPSDLSLLSASPSPSFNLSSNYGGQAASFLVGDSFTYHQILEATDYLHESNLIKRGHSGDLYFGVLESGIQVVVKKVKVSSSSLDKELHLISEMEICRMVHHPRLIPLLGYCLDDPSEKFLVYKHLPKRDLSRFLNGRTDDNRQSTSLGWSTRLKIATGAVEGLCYLHQYSPPLVHRDIQASSILLDDEFEVQLGSLTGICTEEIDNRNRIARFLRSPKGSIRSYFGASNATCAYDVYCFGKILLELVTGKLGTPVNDSATKDWLASTLRHIVADDKKLIVNIVDSSLMMDKHLLLEAWAVAFVAKACLSRNASRRPQMAEILMALGNLARFTGVELQGTGYSSSVALAPSIKLPKRSRMIENMTLKIKPDDISGGSIASRLKLDQLRIRRYLESNTDTEMKFRRYSYADIKRITNGFKEQIAEGGYGIVFKGKISNGMLVAVKLLHKSVGTGEVFINEVAILGIVQHANVVRLLGFCVDGLRRALVYEFITNGTLAAYIPPGKRMDTLGMETLEKIAIGIARGIQHLHQGCEQSIIHYDIKPQNILLDYKCNPKIADFGLAKLFEEESCADSRTYIRGTVGYIAPEVFSRQFGKGSCKSDIYSFGLLLIEMVGRQRYTESTGKNENQVYLPEWVYLYVINGEEGLKYADAIFWKLAIVGLWCIQCYPDDRPSITSVLKMLEGDGVNLSLPPNPFSSQLRRYGGYGDSGSESESGNSETMEKYMEVIGL